MPEEQAFFVFQLSHRGLDPFLTFGLATAEQDLEYRPFLGVRSPAQIRVEFPLLVFG